MISQESMLAITVVSIDSDDFSGGIEESIDPTPQELLQLGTSSATGQLDRLKIANGGNFKIIATNCPIPQICWV
jgi:hypothetical protein